MDNKDNRPLYKEVTDKISALFSGFIQWLKPNPTDHWSLQVLKTIGKIPVVILLIICSPILLVVLLLVFLIAL